MLRTLGASRRQILPSVLFEALAIGLLGAILGIGGGYVMAVLLAALLKAFGVDLPTTSLVMETRTVVVSLLVGIVVTSVSSLVPALRSTRVPPIAALQAVAPPPSRRRRLLYLALSILLGAGRAGGAAVGLFGSGGAGTRGGPDGRRRGGDRLRRLALQPPAGAGRSPPSAGWPLERLRGLIGRLARENSQRNPSRTAVTAAALMIGLALVTFVTVFAAGLKSSVAQVIDENFTGGLVIQNTDGFSPIPAGAAVAARKVPGVELVATIRSTEAKLLGAGLEGQSHGAEPRRRPRRRDRMEAGGTGDAARPARRRSDRRPTTSPPTTVSRSATASAAEPDRRQARLPRRRGVRLQVGRPRQRPRHPDRDGRRLPPDQDTIDFVTTAPGADEARVQAALTAGAEAAFPTAEVLNQQELKESREEQVGQLVNLFYALLSWRSWSRCSASPTRWRSRSTSAPASWGCCGRSGCRAARCAR